MMAVLLFSSGLIMLMLGMIGEYIGRIFICINNSPNMLSKIQLILKEKKKNDQYHYFWTRTVC